MGSVGEYDDAKTDRKVLEIDGPFNFRPTPVADLQEAVAHDDGVDEQMGHRAPERQQAHML